MHPFVRLLLDWYAGHRRNLPWRSTDDAYAIWLSEVILQQTQVAQGLGYWQRFMKRWPTVEALAAASEDEVLREWQGLGYYSRARNLLHAARQITEGDGFPRTCGELMKLKGVGAYTAAAVASFAFGEDVAAVDGNVLRVLSRVFDVDTPVDTTTGRQQIQSLAEQLLPKGRSADWNAALMDFGAMQCTRSPHCDTCCMTSLCEACRKGTAAERPVKSRSKGPKPLHLIYIYVRTRDGHLALHRRSGNGIWQGLWEPVVIKEEERRERREERGVRNVKNIDGYFEGGETQTLTLLADNVKHQLTHLTIYATFYMLECDERPPLPDGYLWIPEDKRDEYAVSRLTEKLYKMIDETITNCYRTEK